MGTNSQLITYINYPRESCLGQSSLKVCQHFRIRTITLNKRRLNEHIPRRGAKLIRVINQNVLRTYCTSKKNAISSAHFILITCWHVLNYFEFVTFEVLNSRSEELKLCYPMCFVSSKLTVVTIEMDLSRVFVHQSDVTAAVQTSSNKMILMLVQ